MNVWNKLDLEAVDMREKIILLTEEFDKKNGIDIEHYNIKLNNLLNRKLKKQSEIILKKHLILSTHFLYIENQKV